MKHNNMKDISISDGTSMTIEAMTQSLNSPNSIYIMLDGGDSIAGRNDKEGWKLAAHKLPAPNDLYSLRMVFLNRPSRYIQLTLDAGAFFGLVMRKLSL